MKTYRLHAVEGDKVTADSLAVLTAALAPALLGHEVGQVELFGGKVTTQHVFTLDAAVMRNTVAHGYGYQAGFLVHVVS